MRPLSFSHHWCWCDVMQARFGGAAYTSVPVTAQRERVGFISQFCLSNYWLPLYFAERERKEKEREQKRKRKKERIYLRVVGAPVKAIMWALFRHIPEIIHSDFHFWRRYFKDFALLYEKKPWSAITWWYLRWVFALMTQKSFSLGKEGCDLAECELLSKHCPSWC